MKTWLLEISVIPIVRTRSTVDRARRDALDVGFLNDGRERLFAHPPRLQEFRELAAFAQLERQGAGLRVGDTQLDRADPGFPGPIPVAIALGQPIGAALAVGGGGVGLHVQFHQVLRRAQPSGRPTAA